MTLSTTRCIELVLVSAARAMILHALPRARDVSVNPNRPRPGQRRSCAAGLGMLYHHAPLGVRRRAARSGSAGARCPMSHKSIRGLVMLNRKLPRTMVGIAAALLWLQLCPKAANAQESDRERAGIYLGMFITNRNTDARVDSS